MLHAPAPTLTVEPVPITRVSQPVTKDSSAPAVGRLTATPLRERVLSVPPPPSSLVSPAILLPLSKVRSPESSASLISPLIAAPLSTMTLSQPFSPSETTVAWSVPDPLLKVSVSLPAPPSSSVALPKAPPSKTSASAPAPRRTFPVIVAPVFTVTEVPPADPMIAFRLPAPINAPLERDMPTAFPLPSSVLIAAASVPEPPVTVPETSMLVLPMPLRSTRIPSPDTPATWPDAWTVTSPVPLETATMPLRAPETSAAAIAIPAPLASSYAFSPSPERPVTEPFTLIEIAPPPVFRATIPSAAPLMFWPVADWVKEMPPLPLICARTKAVPSVSTGVSESTVTTRAVEPLALRDWEAPIRFAPMQANTPLPCRVSSHSLVKNRTRSKFLSAPLNSKR